MGDDVAGSSEGAESSAPRLLPLEALARLFDVLRDRGFSLIGPRLEQSSITFGPIETLDDLPRGVRDEQAPGRTRLRQVGDGALFSFASSSQSFKRFFHAPEEPLLTIRRSRGGLDVQSTLPSPKKIALFGLRGCDLRALEVLDRVMLGGATPDSHYAARRRGAAVIAVNCTVPAATCFCTSMGTGPEARGAFDVSLTELLAPDSHRFVAVAGSPLGHELLDELKQRAASDEDRALAAQALDGARDQIQRHVDTDGLAQRLSDHPEDVAWDDVAARCLSCTNCTMVCPTCFCSTVVDETDLAAEEARRTRRWDSCFTASHSYVHGGSVHASTRSRYRQWLTHKFSTWFDQFGTSGCVGCGRCISACPVGIDVTEVLASIGSRRGASDS